MKYNIFVLCGGKSVEHEVSLKSATAVINSINREKFNVYPVYIDRGGVWHMHEMSKETIQEPSDLILESDLDIYESLSRFVAFLSQLDNKLVFPALHGKNGEDGTMQGFLEILNLPYVGCGVLSSSLAMDKAVTRDLFKTHGLPQANYTYFEKYQWLENKEAIIEDIVENIGLPVYIKPSNSGSSVGINRVENPGDLEEYINISFKYDTKVLVEEELVAREMQVSVIGNKQPMVSFPGEFIMERPFFDYEAKYIDNSIIPVVPANLTPDTSDRVRQLALDTYRVLNCRGLTRVDIFVDANNDIYINEANTMPGFTPVSMTPVLWEATNGTSYTELVEKLIDFGIEEFKERQGILNKR